MFSPLLVGLDNPCTRIKTWASHESKHMVLIPIKYDHTHTIRSYHKPLQVTDLLPLLLYLSFYSLSMCARKCFRLLDLSGLM